MTKRRPAQMPKADRNAMTPADRAERVLRLVSEGAHLLGARRPGEAALLLTEACELDPSNAPAAINLGGAYILQGNHRQAIPVLEAAVRLEPDNAMVWVNLAAAYLGKLPLASKDAQDKAIEAYEKALMLSPSVPQVHYNLGLIYIERNDYPRAADHLRFALETDPADADARAWLEKIRSGQMGGNESLQG